MDPLRTVKLTHTIIWAFFVACILAIPLFTVLSRFRVAAFFAAIVGDKTVFGALYIVAMLLLLVCWIASP